MKAFEIAKDAKERLESALQTTKDKTYETTKSMKEKAFKTITSTKDPLTSHDVCHMLTPHRKCSYFILQTMLTLSLDRKITSMMHC